MIKITRKIEFDAAHRVIGHENKCRFLHGHRYILEITAASNNLNHLGMVTDFGELKVIMKNWIDNNLDHNLILHEADQDWGEMIAEFTGQKIYYLANNPTVENIALHLKKDIIPSLFTDNTYNIIGIKLFETPNSFVEV